MENHCFHGMLDLFLFPTISFIYGYGDDNLARYRLINKERLNPLTEVVLLCILLSLNKKQPHFVDSASNYCQENSYKTTEIAVSAQRIIFSLLTFKRYTPRRQVFGHCFFTKLLFQCILDVRVKILLTTNKILYNKVVLLGWIKAKKRTFFFSCGEKAVTCLKVKHIYVQSRMGRCSLHDQSVSQQLLSRYLTRKKPKQSQ